MDKDVGIQPVHPGDRLTVRTLKGRSGNVIGRLPDGRAVLFSWDSPYLSVLAPGQEVECHVIRIAPRYIIVELIREPVSIEEPEFPQAEDVLLEDLGRLAEEGETEIAIIARALLHIIERLDRRR